MTLNKDIQKLQAQAPPEPPVQITITQIAPPDRVAPPEPTWKQAYQLARTISWGIIMFAFALWMGTKAA